MISWRLYDYNIYETYIFIFLYDNHCIISLYIALLFLVASCVVIVNEIQ